MHAVISCKSSNILVLNSRECDTDWQVGTIETTEASRHPPKKLYSFRTIPVAPFVLDMLQSECERTKIKTLECFLLTHFTILGAGHIASTTCAAA